MAAHASGKSAGNKARRATSKDPHPIRPCHLEADGGTSAANRPHMRTRRKHEHAHHPDRGSRSRAHRGPAPRCRRSQTRSSRSDRVSHNPHPPKPAPTSTLAVHASSPLTRADPRMSPALDGSTTGHTRRSAFAASAGARERSMSSPLWAALPGWRHLGTASQIRRMRHQCAGRWTL